MTGEEENRSRWGWCHVLDAVLSALHTCMLKKMTVDSAVLIPPSCVYKRQVQVIANELSRGISGN